MGGLQDYSAGVDILPWDCVVLGIPKSVQAKSSSIARWKTAVQAAAVAAWPDDYPTCNRHVVRGLACGVAFDV